MKRKVLFLFWIFLWLVIGAIGVEFVSGRLIVAWHRELVNRHMQPYFMTGGYYQTLAKGVKDSLVIGRNGPEAYGYFKQGDLYIYGFEKEVNSIAERGRFLFQDRLELANDFDRDDVKRVFVIGGSAAYGIGASSKKKRWYLLLEGSLSAALGQAVRLIPAAHPGYGSTQERLVLDWMVMPRQPDAVIIFDGFNDAALPAIFGHRPGDPYDQGVLYADFYSPLFGLKKWLAKHSYFFRYLIHRSMAQALAENEKRILDNPQLLNNYVKSVASVYSDNIFHMLETCKSRGIPCGVFLQPVRDITWRSQGKEQQLDPFVLGAYDLIRRRVHRQIEDGTFFDLTAVFDGPGEDQWYRDNVHFNDVGHERISAAIHPSALEMLKPKVADKSKEQVR